MHSFHKKKESPRGDSSGLLEIGHLIISRFPRSPAGLLGLIGQSPIITSGCSSLQEIAEFTTHAVTPACEGDSSGAVIDCDAVEVISGREPGATIGDDAEPATGFELIIRSVRYPYNVARVVHIMLSLPVGQYALGLLRDLRTIHDAIVKHASLPSLLCTW
jgi:hypothetical protein